MDSAQATTDSPNQNIDYQAKEVSQPVMEVNFFKNLLADRTPAQSRELYNNVARVYNMHAYREDYQGPHITAAFIRNTICVSRKASIIELGCGTGLLGSVLYYGYSYRNIDGVDISEEMMNIARRQKCYKYTFLANVKPQAELTFREVQYDCVVMCTALCPGHITLDSLPNIAKKLVKPDGGLIVWCSPTLQFMGNINDDFKEEKFLEKLERICVENNVSLLHRVKVANTVQSIPGEIFVLEKN